LIVAVPEQAELEAGCSMMMPMLQGNGILVKGYKLKINTLLGVSSNAETVSVEAIFTPNAVIEMNFGSAGVGTALTTGRLERAEQLLNLILQ
jgi:phage gp45-like